MEAMELLRGALALVFVLGLIGGAAWAARRFAPAALFSVKSKNDRRLGIIESLQVDGRHRLVLVRRDEAQHLLLIGPNHSQLIESSIAANGKTS
jgi:flagellar protein FliO/FliZ